MPATQPTPDKRRLLDDEGYVIVPDRPGLGITPNYAVLEPHRVE